MKVRAKVTSKVDTKKVKKKVQKANFEAVGQAVATMRLDAISSIRKGSISKSKKNRGQRIASKPGKTPKRWENKTGRSLAYGRGKSASILYDVDRNHWRQTAAILYATPFKPGDQVMRMLEEGGSQYIEVLRRTGIVDDRTRRRDKIDGWKENHYKPMEQRSAKEQQAIKNYYDNIVKQRKVKVRAKYPARPFLMPAVKKNLPRLPAIWKTKINQYFR